MDGMTEAIKRMDNNDQGRTASLEIRAALRGLANDPSTDSLIIESTLDRLKKRHGIPKSTLRAQLTTLRRSQKNTNTEGTHRELFAEKENIPAARLQLAEHIIEKLHCKIKDSRIITYNAETGLYSRDGTDNVIRLAQAEIDEYMSKHNEREILGHVHRSAPIVKEEDLDPDLICVENGILNLKEGTLQPHSPEHVFFSSLPVKYDPDAECALFKTFISQIVRPEDEIIIQEVIGFCLYRRYFLKKAFMFVGSGDNGKSVLLNVIAALLGKENTSHVSLQALSHSPFLKAELYGKYANTYADLPQQAIKDVGTFNMLTGGDLITAERKHEHPFKFLNHAKLLFSCNAVPPAYTDTDAYIDRWIIIVFPNQFKGEDRDSSLTNKLTIPEELSGILNYGLEGLRRLFEQGSFSYSKSTEEIRAEYTRKSNPVAAFSDDRIEISPEGHVIKEELYSAFCVYCKSTGLIVSSEQTFHKRFRQHFSGSISDYRPAGHRKMAYKGIRLKSTQGVVMDTVQRLQEQSLIVDFEDIKQACTGLNDEDIEKELASLKSKGDLYSPEPDKWRTTA